MTDLAFWRTLRMIEPSRVAALLVESPGIRAEVRSSLELLDRELADRIRGAIGFDEGCEERVIEQLAFAMRRPAVLISGEFQRCYAGSWETRSIQTARVLRSSPEHELRRLWQRATRVPTDRAASRSFGGVVAPWLGQFSLEALAREWRPVATAGGVEIRSVLVEDPAGWTGFAQRVLIELMNPFVQATLRRSIVRRELAVDGLQDDDLSPYWSFYAMRRWVGALCPTRSHFLGLSSLSTHLTVDLKDFTKRAARQERSIAPHVHADLEQIEDRRRGAEPTAMILRELLSPEVRRLLRRGRHDQAEVMLHREIDRLIASLAEQGTRADCRKLIERSWFSTVVDAGRHGRGLDGLREVIVGLDPVERRGLDREMLHLLGRPSSDRPVVGGE